MSIATMKIDIMIKTPIKTLFISLLLFKAQESRYNHPILRVNQKGIRKERPHIMAHTFFGIFSKNRTCIFVRNKDKMKSKIKKNRLDKKGL